jgi:hypothetical protein
MPLLRSLGALVFVLGVALLALDGARSLKIRQFEATSLERFWTNLGGDAVFQMRIYFQGWFGTMADQILDLPAAFVALGLGMALLIFSDGAQRERERKPLLF